MIGESGEIVAEWIGGKYGDSHRNAPFAPQDAAANTGTATVVAYTRRQYGTMALLRHNGHCPVETREGIAEMI